MHFIQFLFLLCLTAAALANEEPAEILGTAFFCRLRVSNISKTTANSVRDQNFAPMFEYSGKGDPRTMWLANDEEVGDDDKAAEIMYKVFVPENTEIIAVHYLDLRSLRGLGPEHFVFRCSNGTYINTTHGINIVFTDSFLLILGNRTKSKVNGFVKRPVTLQHQKEADCYVKTGYMHPYNLEEWHRYVASGEDCAHGCSYIGSCKNGAFGAISRCPPQFFPPDKYEIGRLVGECCERGVVKEKVEKQRCPKNETKSVFEQPSPKTHVPWQVRFQKRDQPATQCDGVTIAKEWFLTTKACLSNWQEIEFLRPDGIKYQPRRFRNITIAKVENADDNKGSDLALVKINDSFVIDDWTTAIQKINLPWNKIVCELFLEKSCHVLLGTQQQDENRDDTTVFGQVINPEATPLTYLKRVKKLQNVPVLLGSGVVGWYEKANFLVGIYVGNAMKSTAGDKITFDGPWKDNSDSGDFISICPFLDSIQQKVKEDPKISGP